jgi:hypothetical protein
VQTLGGKSCLFILPPYSLDRNPNEWVWKHLKADTVGRMAVTGKEDFSKKARRSMRELQNDARQSSSSFKSPHSNMPHKYEYGVIASQRPRGCAER